MDDMASNSSSLNSVKTGELAGLLVLFLPIMGFGLYLFLLAVRKADAFSNPWFWASAMMVLGLWALMFYIGTYVAENKRGWAYPTLPLVGLGGSFLLDATIAKGVVNGAAPVVVFYLLVPTVGICAIFAFVLAPRLVRRVSKREGTRNIQ